MASEIGDLFVTLRAVTEPYTAPMTESATVGEDATSKIIAATERMASSLEQSAELAATAIQSILDSVLRLAEGVVEPLDSVKASVRQVASALRALGKAATGLDETAIPAFETIGSAATEMATSLATAVDTAKASFTGLSTEFDAVAASATKSAAEVTVASEESATAVTAAGDAAAVSAGKSSAALGETASGLSKFAMGLAAAGFGVFEAIKGATKFNSLITQLTTQAGVLKGQLPGLGQGVLDLAGQVGQNPDSLAEALYHVESSFASTGITGRDALNIVKTAAEGASIGGANLVDVQNALDAAIASGIPGVQNYSQAMGALNSIVGAGDMQMQDLANALGTGVLAVVKGYGLTLNDVGASLATFGDNNIRGSVAATDLRMAVQALAVPTKDGAIQLQKWGLSADSLSKDMQQHGLVWTLNALHDLFVKNGVSATEQGQIITDMFGKKAGAGLAVLLGQLDRVNSKVPDIAKGASGFADAWTTTSHTVGQEFADLKSGLESLAIKIGNMLLPYITKFLGWVRDGVAWITSHKSAVEALAAVLGGVLLTAIVAIAGAVVTMEAPFTLAEVAIAAVGAAIFYAYTHFSAFRTIVNDVGRFLMGAFKVAWTVAGQVIDWFRTTVLPAVRAAIADLVDWWHSHQAEFSAAWHLVLHEIEALAKWFNDHVIVWVKARIAELVAWWHDHSAEISAIWSATWKVVKDVVTAEWTGVIRPILQTIAGYWKLVWDGIKDTAKLVWSIISDYVTGGMHLIENVIGLILDVVTGKWGKAWGDLKKLVSDAFHDVTKFMSDAVSGFGTLLWDAGRNLISGLINGIKSAASGIGSTVGGIAKNIRDFFPFSPAKTGPLSGSGSIDIAGRKLGTMLADGMHSSAGVVAQAATRLAGVAAGAAPGAAPGAARGSSLTVGGAAASVESLAVALSVAAGGGGQLPPIVVQIDGRELFKILQVQALQNGRRNPSTGLVYT